MKRHAVSSISISVLLFTVIPVICIAQQKEKKDDAAQKKPAPKFTIGRETTYVRGPIDQDGFIDYETALNERLSAGVTPQNNANMLLWQAFGPHPEGSNVPAEFFTWLKIQPPREKGEYFIPLHQYARDELKLGAENLNALDEEIIVASSRPWKAQERPRIAQWLARNEKPLALVMAATKRTHYYYPLVVAKTKGKSGSLFAALLPGAQACRHLATALTARAMLRTGERKHDDAWQDLLATHRLGRHVSSGGTIIEGLIGIAIDQVAANADLAFLDAARLDAKKTRSCLHDLQSLPSLPLMADKINLCERFLFLDTIMQVEYHGLGFLGVLGGDQASNSPILKLAYHDVHWDTAMRNGNDMFSRLSAAMRLKDRGMREKELFAIEKEIKTRKANLTTPGEFVRTLLTTKNVGDAKGKYIGEILITLLVPAVSKVQHAADRSEQSQRNLQVAFALAAYRADQGGYPKTLDALTPKYLATVPHDVFSGKGLIYRLSETGYLFYSVGVNGQDEEGRGYDDEPRGDDLAVRMPVRKADEKK